MITAQDKAPALPAELDSLFRPRSTPAPPRKKYSRWHVATLIIGVPVIAFLSCVGANTVVNWWLVDAPAAQASATATQKAKADKPKAPAYNLPGFRSAITGTEKQALASALWAVRSDIRRPDYPAALTDTPRLITAANEFLSLVRSTNPPPSYGPEKLGYIQAGLAARKAGTEALEALQTANLGLLQKAADEAARARWLLSHASASAPRGS
jgi:hypothetical protein